MADLLVAFDPSASLSKAFYKLRSFDPKLILLESDVVSVPPESVARIESDTLGVASPEDCAWLELNGAYYAVGYLARTQFYEDLKLKHLKHEVALYKLLALIGAIATKEKLPENFTLSLGVLLPYGERGDTKTLEAALVKGLNQFSFRGKLYHVQLENYECLAEGSGLLLRGRKAGMSLRSCNVDLIMLGYRNGSYLRYRRGIKTEALTSENGFGTMLKRIIDTTSGQNERELLTVVGQVGNNLKPEAFLPLTRSRNVTNKCAESERIAQAVELARKEYWQQLSEWLPERKADVDEVILAGGTAHYYRKELEEFYQPTPIEWCDRLEDQLKDKFGEFLNKYSLPYRLTDAYGFFYYLLEKYDRAKAKEVVIYA